ncbi:MAG: phage baseplate protein [Porticoccaceae bacterium]
MARARYGGVYFDALSEESIEARSEVSEHTIEDGSAISDHVRPQSLGVQVRALLTGPDWQDRYRRLREAERRGVVTTYAGVLEVLENCVIDSLTPHKDAQIANGVELDIRFRQVRIAKLSTREIRLPDPVTEVKPESKPVEAGKKEPKKETPQETQEKNKPSSWMLNMAKKLGLVK